MLSALASLIERHGTRPVAPSVRAFADTLLRHYGNAVVAILIYGSCFRRTTDEGLVDLYVLVDDYRRLPGIVLHHRLYRVLPPIVFYLEIPYDGRLVRAKYAVLSLAEFERGASAQWFHAYLWGRFAQPTGLLYARDVEARRRGSGALGQAIVTFVSRVLPMAPPRFEAGELWRRGLSLSYGTELRPDPPDAARGLVDADPDYYEQVTRIVMKRMPFDVRLFLNSGRCQYQVTIAPWTRFISRLAWKVRNVQGKVFNVLRLLKGLLTFKGGVDYLLWKIARHTGTMPEIPERLRRHPCLSKILLFWKFYRRGAFR